MKSINRRNHKIKGVVAITLLAMLFWFVPFDKVVQALRQADALDIYLATAVSFLVLGVASWRLKQLILPYGLHLSTTAVFSINLRSMFYGLILPGSNVSGAAVKFYKLYRVEQNMIGIGLALFFDRLVATIVLLLLGVAFWLIHRPVESVDVFLIMLGLLVVTSLLCFSVLVLKRMSVLNLLENLISQSLCSKIRHLGEMAGVLRTISRNRLVAIFASAIMTHLLSIVTFFILARSVGVGLSLTFIGWIRSAMILAKMIPVSVYGLGLREGATIYILSAYGGLPEIAVAFSLLIFIVCDLVPALLGGLLELRGLLLDKTPPSFDT